MSSGNLQPSSDCVLWREMRLSRLMLGTVQFGMPYGIANRNGQPEYRDVLEMLDTAIQGGVNCFDTAAAYGSSEEVLGRALQELRVHEQVTVVTKVKPLTPDELANPGLAAAALERSLDSSRRLLKLDCLPVVLFHREPDAAFLDHLNRLKDRGWLRHAGVSCSNYPGPSSEYVRSGLADALQLPANVIDRRHQQSGIFDLAAQSDVAVFIRSVFLQGLLLMPESEVPEALRDVLPVRLRLQEVAAEAGISVAELAVRYVLSQDGVTCILAGVETVAQVRENLRLFQRGPLSEDVSSAVDNVTADLSEMILTPALWPPRNTIPVSPETKPGDSQ